MKSISQQGIIAKFPATKKRIDISGMKFGKLTVIDYAHSKDGKPQWNAVCDCGVSLIADGSSIKQGRTVSCGCGRAIHGMSLTPEYRAWRGMCSRCGDPKHAAYKNYGARGILVCDRWLDSLDNFIVDMGLRPSPNHQLDRIDNNSGYSAENCRWVTATVNNRNRRSNRLIEMNGETRILVEWCEIFNIRYSTVTQRLAHGWSEVAAITTPVLARNMNFMTRAKRFELDGPSEKGAWHKNITAKVQP